MPLGDDERSSCRVGVVADDWRLTVTFRDEADVQQAVQSVREHEVEDDVRSRLGHRVAMSVDGPTVFLYAGTEDTARETDRVVREVLARRQLSALAQAIGQEISAKASVQTQAVPFAQFDASKPGS
jgi:hypothetical protein